MEPLQRFNVQRVTRRSPLSHKRNSKGFDRRNRRAATSSYDEIPQTHISWTRTSRSDLSATASAQMMINGAGATFPYPIYSKWFDEYAKVDPSVRFNYQSIGSGGGQKQILAQTVDFGASDGPMSDDNLAKAPGKILHIPTVAGAVVVTYNLAGKPGAQSSMPTRLRVFSLARSRNGMIRRSRQQTLEQNCPTRTSWLCIDPMAAGLLHLHRLPEQGQCGMEIEGGHEHIRELASRDRWQRE